MSRPRFYGEFIRKTFEYRRIGPDLTVIFFFCNIFEKKKFLCVHCSGTYIGQTKNITRGKNFCPNPPNLDKFLLPTNLTDRCLEDP